MKHPYCVYVSSISDSQDVDKVYHDTQYGVSISDDNELFGRLLMEINQAGLSWRTILLKEKGFRKAYSNFSITKVATYKEKDIDRLLSDASIIRNRLKIHAAIYNASALCAIQQEYGSFRAWLDVQAVQCGHNKKQWLTLFKKHFKFVGGEIVGEFLMSIGLLPGSHDKDCEFYR